MIVLLPHVGFLSETSRMIAIDEALRARGVDASEATHGGTWEETLRASGVAFEVLEPRMTNALRGVSAPDLRRGRAPRTVVHGRASRRRHAHLGGFRAGARDDRCRALAARQHVSALLQNGSQRSSRASTARTVAPKRSSSTSTDASGARREAETTPVPRWERTCERTFNGG